MFVDTNLNRNKFRSAGGASLCRPGRSELASKARYKKIKKNMSTGRCGTVLGAKFICVK
ncbi:MAG: hypothetical protein ACI9YB_003280, partial [Halioglobus sp.]